MSIAELERIKRIPDSLEIERIIRQRQQVVASLTAHGIDFDLQFLNELLGHLEEMGPNDRFLVLSSDRAHPPIFISGGTRS